jgi:chloramphenicol 3-O phosphotransferase
MNKLIILNGTSSSGKTTLAKYLQKLLPEPYCNLCMDVFMDMGAKKFPFDTVVPPIIASMMQSIPVFLKNNNNVIVDCVLFFPLKQIQEIKDALKFHGIEEQVLIFLIKVFASKDALTEREIQRDDRQVGIAIGQIEVLHKDVKYDMEIDTTSISPLENAKKIAQFINTIILKDPKHT